MKRRRRRSRTPLYVLAALLAAFAVGFLGGALWRQPRPVPADVAAREATPRPAPAPRETPRVTPRATPRPAGGRIALVIDDLGRRPSDLATIAALGVPVAHAVLPYEPHSAAMAAAAAAAGAEVLLHLPMEALDGEDPGPGALRLGMDDAALAAATRAALAAVPEAVGINNHMGSALSADRRAMAVVLGVARERGLFFLDSRTTAATVGFRLARELGVPAAERQVFLDDSLSAADIEAELERLRALALEEGSAIAIGHPHPVTFAQLAAEVPRAQAAGVRFVRLSELLAR
ncbi:MAG: divergent polysaccharide deacetylase family protein [Acidobacteria bacterium]|nr:divergent polysaccharide deacetylase family protein [Thermoanaerobaculia bacterium]NLN10947.1 divergent polysaccharide deacetylase family protein [Acidobacteriota bacterium]MBP7813084.1 divergent polysaccharide deacetylase family protein [Thermoanaerobaculia bacterium]MBP8845820.1 divergent polysaccharide deacetylase family protein [Thermoanaerobaculia bacterium]HQN38518.1 divergent polysaccharide deacetylase family protein [Thermoanaerobaculia bacterium]